MAGQRSEELLLPEVGISLHEAAESSGRPTHKGWNVKSSAGFTIGVLAPIHPAAKSSTWTVPVFSALGVHEWQRPDEAFHL
jgi:hypothetical protein